MHKVLLFIKYERFFPVAVSNELIVATPPPAIAVAAVAAASARDTKEKII